MTDWFTAFDADGREFQMPYMPPIDPDLVVFNDAGTAPSLQPTRIALPT